jgi:HK97 family phage major capsid protein
MPQTTAKWRSEASADELATRAAEMRSEWATTSETLRSGDSAAFDTARSAFLAEVEDIDVNMTLRGIEAMPAGLRGQVRGGDNGTIGAGDQRELRSAGQIVIEDEAFKAWAGSGARGESPSVELRALVAENDSNGSSGLLPVGQPFLVNQRRQRLFIRDLIGVQQTGLAAIPYVRELNPIANQLGANVVSEGGTKPEATIQLTPDLAPVQVIAVTLPVTTQIVEDGLTLMGYINGRLTYMLKIREEGQILSGSGTTPNLKGILSYSGVQTVTGSTDALVAIGTAIGKIELVDGFADGVAMNPGDFWAMMTRRTTQSATANTGQFDAEAFTTSPAQFVWGLPVVRSNSLTAKQTIVGNYSMGATLFDRSQSGVRVFEQHGTFAAENKVLLRAEERLALAVNRPDFFVNVTLP